jgi:hypothetical protein
MTNGEDGKCEHIEAYKGTHPSFRKGWLCPTCEKLVDIDLTGYGVVFYAVKLEKLKQDGKQPIA